MIGQDFVTIISQVLVTPTVQDVVENLTSPPGRKPNPDRIMMSDWYNRLPDSDKDHVSKVIQEAVASSVFGFLCILDGVRAIEDAGPKGQLELYFVKDGNRTLINDPAEQFLHDLFDQ